MARGNNERNIEGLVNGAMGNSVTPSRLHTSMDIGFFRRLLGHESVEGPFIDDLKRDEQPHYLLHSVDLSANSNSIDGDTQNESRISSLTRPSFSPVTLLVTDKRLMLIRGSDDSRCVTSVDHSEITEVDLRDLKIKKDLIIRTPEDEFDFGILSTYPYASELSDAAAYVFERSQAEGEYQSYNFDSDNYNTAKTTLEQQLNSVQKLADEVDIEKVAQYGVEGAKIGKRRGPQGAGIGFMLGAGFGIWTDLNSNSEINHAGSKNDSDVDDRLAANINPEQTAEAMLRWQQAGRISDKQGIELASGAIGAALSIDEQTSGREVSSALANLDIKWISQQLEAGNKTEAGLQIASEVIEPYSEEIAAIIDDEFFEQLTD